MKKFLAIALLLLITACASAESVEVRHFLKAPCVSGESGFAFNPSAYILDNDMASLGLHPFIFKANYGLMHILEAGLVFDFGADTEILKVIKDGRFNLKVNALQEENHFITLTGGLERIPLNLFEDLRNKKFGVFAVATKSTKDFTLSVGVRKDLSKQEIDLLVWEPMIDVGWVVADTVMLVLEHEGGRYHAGAKVSLNYNISVEGYIKNLQDTQRITELGSFLREYFVFGITYLQ